jgi:DNA-binding transcriptional regulator YhcF (GntR family)
MSRTMKIVLVLAILLISAIAAGLSYANRPEGKGFGAMLTKEQREAVHAKIMEMRDAGATREEIHAAVREMMEGYGITPPEGGPAGRPEGLREGHGPGGHVGAMLTEEQREAVHAKVMEMRDAGASSEEIHAAVREMMQGYGITPPEGRPQGRREGFHEGQGPGGHAGAMLTEEQREAIHAKVMEMRNAGASREDIRAAVREMLAGFGIDISGCHGTGTVSPGNSALQGSPREGARWGEIKGWFE